MSPSVPQPRSRGAATAPWLLNVASQMIAANAMPIVLSLGLDQDSHNVFPHI